MQLSPHLSFNGQCEAAFKLYQECLGGTMQFKMTWGESPMADEVGAEWRNKVCTRVLSSARLFFWVLTVRLITMKYQGAFP